jgi:hypothetical protein
VNIQARTQAQLDEHPVDVAVMLFGTNDAQGIDTGGVAATGGDPFSFSLEGRLEGEDDVIVGTCVFGVPGGTGGLTGALRVER